MQISAKAAPMLALVVSGVGSYGVNQIFRKTEDYLILRTMKARSVALEDLIEKFNRYSKAVKSSLVCSPVCLTSYSPQIQFYCPHQKDHLVNLNSIKPYCEQGKQDCLNFQAEILKKSQPFNRSLEILESIKKNRMCIALIIGIASSIFSIRIVLSKDAHLITKVTTFVNRWICWYYGCDTTKAVISHFFNRFN